MGYAIGYSYELRSAEWIAYLLTKETQPGVDRQNDFRVDPEIPKEYQTSPADYVEPIYDMGHLANSESIDQSIAANSETFLTSNIVPQLPGFNRAIWKGLENKERRMAEKYGEVWIVTGPIYSEPMKYIGRAPIPAAFFKVFYYNGSVEAYLLPHLELQTSSLQKHRASVEAVENAAGLNL